MDRDALRRLARIFEVIGAWSQRMEGGYPVPRDRSPLARDDRDTAPFQVSHAVVAALASALDHVKSLEALFMKAQIVPARGSFTLLRAALENAAVAVWLLSPTLRTERVLRRLRLQWADMVDNDSALALTGMTRTRSLDENKRRLQDLARAANLSTEQVSQVASRPVAWNTIVSDAGQAARSLDRKWVLLMWKLCSGIAHARPWAVLGLLDREEISRTTEDILNVQISASDTAVWQFTAIAGLMIHDAWALFDQCGTPPY